MLKDVTVANQKQKMGSPRVEARGKPSRTAKENPIWEMGKGKGNDKTKQQGKPKGKGKGGGPLTASPPVSAAGSPQRQRHHQQRQHGGGQVGQTQRQWTAAPRWWNSPSPDRAQGKGAKGGFNGVNNNTKGNVW